MSNAWDGLFAAALTLASAGPIKQRLSDAYDVHLARLQSHEFPRELREDFDDLRSSLCKVKPMRGETTVQATVRKMSDAQAGEYAQRIVRMLGEMARLQMHRPPHLRAVNSDN